MKTNEQSLKHIMTFESYSEKYENGELVNEGIFDSKKTKLKKELETLNVEDDEAVNAFLYKVFASNQIPGFIKNSVLPTATSPEKLEVIKAALNDNGDGVLNFVNKDGVKKLAYRDSKGVNWSFKQHIGGAGA